MAGSALSFQGINNDTHVPQLGAWVPCLGRVGRQGTWRLNPNNSE